MTTAGEGVRDAAEAKLGRLVPKGVRVPMGFAAVAVLVLVAQPTPSTLAVGWILVVLGEGARVLSAGSLVKAKALTEWGIYGHARHPLYVGSALIGLGFGVMAGSWPFISVFCAGFPLLYGWTIAREERALARRYGALFEAYAGRVPRFLPRRFSPRALLGPFTWRRAVVNREHRTIVGIAALASALVLKWAMAQTLADG
jgi:protein-S-isoprenylcysteine O-methyltransferase Ste14